VTARALVAAVTDSLLWVGVTATLLLQSLSIYLHYILVFPFKISRVASMLS